jgi:glycosyltransferase involved in cell wall biosynthesis
MKQPLVSVIMPVYNASSYLKESIDSILEQTYTNFELLAINDGSTDDSDKLLEHYAKLDPRIKIVTHKKNMRLVATLNEGLNLAKGEYIARMDSDDISFPKRFELQVAVLQKEPQIVLVAGAFEVIDEDGEFMYREVMPVNDRDIKRVMLLRNVFAHGSVMFRKSAIEQVGPYRDDCGPTEDFELWSRLSTIGEFRGLETAIFRWRVNMQGISRNSADLAGKYMKQHTDTLWAKALPMVIGSNELRRDSRYYFQKYKKHGFEMRKLVLNTNAQIGIGLIHRGHPLSGAHQLLAVALVGRSGLRAVIHRTRSSLQTLTRGNA